MDVMIKPYSSDISSQSSPSYLGAFVFNIMGDKAYLYLKVGELEAKIHLEKNEDDKSLTWNQLKLCIPHGVYLFGMEDLLGKLPLQKQYQFMRLLRSANKVIRNFGQPLKIWIKCLEIAKEWNAKDSNCEDAQLAIIESYTSTAHVSLNLGNYKKALEYLGESKMFGISTFGERHLALAAIYTSVGPVCHISSKFRRSYGSY